MKTREKEVIDLASSPLPSSSLSSTEDVDSESDLEITVKSKETSTKHDASYSGQSSSEGSEIEEVVVNESNTKSKKTSKPLKQLKVDTFYKRNPSVEIISTNEENDEGSHGDSPIEVLDSSPVKPKKMGASIELDSSPIKSAKTKLPSLRSFAYKDPKEAATLDTNKNKLPSNKIFENLLIFRKNYPHLTQRVILGALKKMDSLVEIKSYLDGLPKTDSKLKSNSVKRLTSLSKNSPILSSSPLKGPSAAELRLRTRDRKSELERERARRRAERETIKSSKVVLDSKKSIKDRFLTKHRRIYQEKPETDEAISLDDSESSSDESDEETESKLSVKKRRYEDDDDYAPIRKTKLKLRRRPSEDSKKTFPDREFRAQRRHEIEKKMLPELEEDEDAGLNITERFLKLVNNADIHDIIDLSNIKPAEATIIVENRPYNSINDFLKLKLKTDSKSKLPNASRNYAERVVETCKQKLIAYGAIDSLVKQCFSFSKDITREIMKWGVDIEGQKANGEVAITEVDAVDDSSSESDEESESNASDSDSGSDSDVQIINKRQRKSWKYDDDDDDNADEDFDSGHKKLYKSNINTDNVKDKIGYFKKRPKLLKSDVTLKSYQQVGVNWLNLLFQKRLSCILADEMGLGKTIQVIAFLAHLKEKRYPGPHLIVVPSSTLENWLREFQKFAPSLDVIPYYGSLAEREELRSVLMDEKFDVMVTTYNLATIGKLDQPFLRSFEFNTIVYDEGHMLKNATSDRYKKLTKLRAHFRVLLTGTPLQNNLKELVSLLDFILPEIFDPRMNQLELLFDKKATTKDDETIEGESYNPLLSQQAIAKAKVMMTPFILRRTKALVMKDLPEKHTSIEYTNMTAHQRSIYDNQLKALDDFRKERELRKTMSAKDSKNLQAMKTQSANALMSLRKACLHPLLFRYHYNDKMLKLMSKSIMKNENYHNANQDYIYEDMEVMSDFELAQLCHQFPSELGKFVLKQEAYMDSGKVEALIRLLTDIIGKGEKILVFSLFTQMLDILEKVLSLKNWKFLRLDGSTAVETRQTMIDKFYEDKTIPIFLLSTKAGGFGINLICANHVIIYDQSFNPHDDKQAEDRAHRVGQVKEVYVTRLITKNSIEENILQLAYNKLQLDQSMMKQPTEDILLKTVEDMLSSKEKDEPIVKEPEVETNQQSAFETNLDMELRKVEEDDDDIQVIENIGSQPENGRGRRKRNTINYKDDIDLKGIIESEGEDDLAELSPAVEPTSDYQDDADEADNDIGTEDNKPKDVKVPTNDPVPVGYNQPMAWNPQASLQPALQANQYVPIASHPGTSMNYPNIGNIMMGPQLQEGRPSFGYSTGFENFAPNDAHNQQNQLIHGNKPNPNTSPFFAQSSLTNSLFNVRPSNTISSGIPILPSQVLIHDNSANSNGDSNDSKPPE